MRQPLCGVHGNYQAVDMGIKCFVYLPTGGRITELFPQLSIFIIQFILIPTFVSGSVGPIRRRPQEAFIWPRAEFHYIPTLPQVGIYGLGAPYYYYTCIVSVCTYVNG